MIIIILKVITKKQIKVYSKRTIKEIKINQKIYMYITKRKSVMGTATKRHKINKIQTNGRYKSI